MFYKRYDLKNTPPPDRSGGGVFFGTFKQAHDFTWRKKYLKTI